jgi:hypothetical protein
MLLALGLLTAKLTLLLWLGPLVAPDSGGYVEFAQRMLTDPSWRTTVDFSQHFAPETIYRMIGYPMLIVGAQTLFGAKWPYPLVLFQLILAVYATVRFFGVLDRILTSRSLAIALTVIQATAINIAFDQFVLTDSLYLSLMLLATCSIVEIALDGQASWGRLIEISGCFLASFLLREATSTLALCWVPLLVIALSRTMSTSRALLFATLVLAPMFATKAAYSSWNFARTGERMVTTSYQLVLLQPLVKGYRYDKSIFAGDTPFDSIARRSITTFQYEDALILNQLLFAELGWTAPVIAKEAERRFWRFAWNHPLAWLSAVREEMRFNHAMALVAPVPSMNFLLGWATRDKNPLSLSTLIRRTIQGSTTLFLPILSCFHASPRSPSCWLQSQAGSRSPCGGRKH